MSDSLFFLDVFNPTTETLRIFFLTSSHRLLKVFLLIGVLARCSNITNSRKGLIMAKITKKELADALVEAGVVTSKASGVKTIEAVFAAIANGVQAGNEVEVFGFGKFGTKSSAAREGINPKTKEKIQISARTAPSFKAAAAFKAKISG